MKHTNIQQQSIRVTNTIETTYQHILAWILIPLTLAVITAVVYYPSLRYPFQFDDAPNILKFFNIRHATFHSLFLANSRWISYWLNTLHYRLGEFDPLVYRQSNLIFHTLTGILTYAFTLFGLSGLQRPSFFTRNARSIACFTSILFLLHPVQTQTVSYVIQGQLEGLACLFTMAISTCFLLFTRTHSFTGKTVLGALLAILAFFASGTKEIVIVIPALTLLIDWFFVAQGNWSQFKKRLVVHAFLAGIIGSMLVYFLKPSFFANVIGLRTSVHNNYGNMLTKSPIDMITPYLFFISQFKVILHYIVMFLWPHAISVEYDWKLVDGFADPACWAPLLMLTALGIGISYLLKRNSTSPIAFGALWFFICLAPRSTIIPSTELLVDYKTYSASIGWLFILALGITALCNWLSIRMHNYAHARTLIFISTGIILVVGSGWLTVNRNTVWRSGVEFWHNILTNAPGKARAYNNYGYELSERGEYEKAIPYYKKAIAMEGQTYWDPYTNLAGAYALTGRVDDAITVLLDGLKVNPHQPEAHNNLGAFYLHKQDFVRAEQCFNQALALMPHYGRALYNLGRLYLVQGHKERAWLYFKRSCTEADLDHEVTSLEPYAQLSAELGKFDEALVACKRMVKLRPNEPKALANLANAHYLCGQYQQALILYDQLITNHAPIPGLEGRRAQCLNAQAGSQ